MFSGLVPHRNGMTGLAHRGFSLKKGINYLPDILSKNGYRTILFGIQHEATWGNQNELGYQEFYTGKTSSCVDVGKLVIEFLETRPEGPFFISAGCSETHQRYPIVENPPVDLKVPEFLPDDIEVKKDIAGLNILVERVDKTIGQILSAMERTGRDRDTLLIFTTDHGIAMPGAKATLFDPGIEIFLMLKGPGIPEGKRIDCLSYNVDLMPTILDYLGLEIPQGLDGESLMPVIKGEKNEIHDAIYPELTYHAAYDPMRAIRTRKYKYISCFEARPFYFPPNVDNSFSKDLFKKLGYFERLRPFEFLFDLENDPLERNNLAGNEKYKDLLEEFRKRLTDWMRKTEDPLLRGPVPAPEGSKISVPWAYNPEQVWEKEF